MSYSHSSKAFWYKRFQQKSICGITKLSKRQPTQKEGELLLQPLYSRMLTTSAWVQYKTKYKKMFQLLYKGTVYHWVALCKISLKNVEYNYCKMVNRFFAKKKDTLAFSYLVLTVSIKLKDGVLFKVLYLSLQEM